MKAKAAKDTEISRGLAAVAIAIVVAASLCVIAFGGVLWVWPTIFGGAIVAWIYDQFF